MEPISTAIEREKERLPFGWGRFGKALDRLGELLEPGEELEIASVGVYSKYREQHVFGELGAGQTNAVVGVTDRRLFLIGTTLRGKPLGHDAIEWAEVSDFSVVSDKKRSIAVTSPGGTAAVDSIAKSAFADLMTAVAAHTRVRDAGG